MELVVTDLAASRAFYVDLLGLHVTEEDDDAIYLRSLEEFIHHNLVLRQGPVAAVAAFAYRVRTPEDLDTAVAFYQELGCRVERRADGFTKGIGDSVRVEDPLGFPYEFFHDVEHVERLTWRYDLLLAGRAGAPGPLQPGHPGRAPRPRLPARTSASACPRTSRTPRAPCTPPGCTASRPSTTPR